MINQLNRAQAIVDKNGLMSDRFQDWAQNVTRLAIITGEGSPEGLVEALQTQLYMNITGTAGNILYIKRDADINGNKSMGWILV